MSDTYKITGSGAEAKYTIAKVADAKLDYPFDWATEYLAEINDTIKDHEIIVDNGIVCESSSAMDGKVVAWISGGTVGNTYKVTCKITTNGGRTDLKSIHLKII